MHQIIDDIIIATDGPNLIEITNQINKWVIKKNCNKGVLNLYIFHTSASLLIQENADPDVLEDLITFYSKIAPTNNNYKHQSEGKDDMPAHIKSSLTNTSLTISIINQKLMLGVWQGVYLFEHRDRSMKRKINLHFLGE